MRCGKGKIKFGICTISIYGSTVGVYTLPIVVGDIGIAVHVVAVYIENAGNSGRLGIGSTVCPGLKNPALYI